MLNGVFGSLHSRPQKPASQGQGHRGGRSELIRSSQQASEGQSVVDVLHAMASGVKRPAGALGDAGPSKKRKKKQGGGGGGGQLQQWGGPSKANFAQVMYSSATAWMPPEVPAVQHQVSQHICNGALPAAAALFLQNAKAAHGAAPALLFALLQKGDVVTATEVIRRGKVHAALPHRSVIECLLAMPQVAGMEEGRCFVEVLSGAVAWPSRQHEDYFRRAVRPVVLEFLEEASAAVQALRLGDSSGLRRGECVLGVLPRPGLRRGELACDRGATLAPANSPSRPGADVRGMMPGDSVALTPMEGLGDCGICECSVAVGRPLVIRASDQQHPVFQRAVKSGGLFRVDKLANRTGYGRMVSAVHCLAEPDRKAWDEKPKVPRRLPKGHRPAQAVRDTLVAPTPGATLASGSAEVEVPEGFNESQAQAVASSSTRSVSLIQGPPGTGKTRTAVQILKHWTQTTKKARKKSCVLATSDSNIAVDNLLEGLVRAGVRAVRLGRPEAARPEMLEHTADAKAAKSLGVPSLGDVQDKAQAKVAVEAAIEEAEVVCCTAIGAGAGLLNDFSFSLVLVDEAAQATEPATLVPICHGCAALVLVGDHCQLPPTVASAAAARGGLARSLFERLAAARLPMILLQVQYRMHPALSSFPRQAFYAGRLSDGVDADDRPALEGVAWPRRGFPVCVLPVQGQERAAEGKSFENEAEASQVALICKSLLDRGLPCAQLGVVTPYGAQVRLIRRKLQQFGIPVGRERDGVEVNSVDGFQGREKDAIVMSTVRASLGGGIGFVADWRRANVAFTRARRGLVVLCHPPTLARDARTWLPWLHWAREQGCISGGALPLPALNPNVPPVGLAELEAELVAPSGGGLAAPTIGAGRRAREPSRTRSPSPEWKLTLAQKTARTFSADLMPAAPGREKVVPGPRQEDDEDDRHEGASDGRRGARDFGNAMGGDSILGAMGYGFQAKVAKPFGPPKNSPSPFLSGPRLDVSQAFSADLGLKARALTPSKPAPAAKRRPRAAKAAKTGGGGGLLGAAYASSSEDADETEDEEYEEEEEEGSSDEAEKAQATTGGNLPQMPFMPLAAADGDEDDESSGEESAGEAQYLLEEILR